MAFYDGVEPGVFDPILTNFSVGFQDQALIGEQACPLVPVLEPGGKYAVWDRSMWVFYDDHREPGANAVEVRGHKWSEDNFFVEEHAVQVGVTDEERQNYGNIANQQFGALPASALFVNPEVNAVAQATRSIMLRYEYEVSTLMRATGSYASGNHTSVTNKWDNYTVVSGVAVSNPIADIENAMRVIFAAVHETPNLMIVPWDVWSWLRNHPAIVDRIKYHDLTEDDAFLQLTGFQGQVLIPASVYNSAQNTDATESITTFWGKDVILAKVDTTPQLNTQTFVKGFSQTYPSGLIRTVDRWREPGRWRDVIATKQRWDLKVTSNAAAFLLQAAIS